MASRVCCPRTLTESIVLDQDAFGIGASDVRAPFTLGLGSYYPACIHAAEWICRQAYANRLGIQAAAWRGVTWRGAAWRGVAQRCARRIVEPGARGVTRS